MILGIGVDVLQASRITAILSRRGRAFPSRILSTEEFAAWNLLPFESKCRFLAVRWCVKEAAYKALYPVIRPTWKELTYRSGGESGRKPSLHYLPSDTHKNTKCGSIHVSVSHDGDYVFATVLVEGEQLVKLHGEPT